MQGCTEGGEKEQRTMRTMRHLDPTTPPSLYSLPGLPLSEANLVMSYLKRLDNGQADKLVATILSA